VAMRFNPPPGWPPPPPGFVPGPGWRPDASWPPPPDGWQLWLPDDPDRAAAMVQGQLTPGYVAYGPPQAPPSSSGTSGMAIASFVLGLLGIVGISAILGIVLGIGALRRIGRTFQRGRGLAIAGIILGSSWLVLAVAVAVIASLGNSSTPASQPGAETSSSAGASRQTVDPFSLVTGDCFDNPTATPGQTQHLTSVVQTPCNQAHNAQVFATFNVSGSMLDYPGSAKLHSIAGSGCAARAKASLNRAKLTNSMTVRFLFPLESSWLGGRRTVSCIVYNPTPTLTSSLVKS
jgi:Domain of unknown function (DUF4190)/Septum formation